MYVDLETLLLAGPALDILGSKARTKMGHFLYLCINSINIYLIFLYYNIFHLKSIFGEFLAHL